jgi:hypothetical protein
MSSIRELFGDIGLNDEEGGNAPFDPSKLNETLDAVLRDRPPAGAPEGFVPSPADPPTPPDGGTVDGGEVGAAPPAAPAPLPPAPVLPDPGLTREPPPPPADLFASMSDLDRQELLAIRQALADPERQQAIRRAYLGVETPVSAPPPPPAKATLPEDVDPDSFEAKLWQQNQDLQARLDQLTQGVQQQTQQTEAERANAAARKVTADFAGRYGDKLSPEEIQAVCAQAGAQKLPEAFLPTTGGNLEAAMTKSLEFVLRSNDTLLAKVLGAPAAPPVDPNARSAASVDRTRKLTALSSAASPGGDVPTRPPIEHREDGRLTEVARTNVVEELVRKMRAEGEGS